jgi:cell division protein FtsB
MNIRKKWKDIFVSLVLIALFVCGNRGLWQLYRLHQDKKYLSEAILKLKTEINSYQLEYQTFDKNPFELEKRAREELNLVKPGEVVYRFGVFGQ